MRKNKLLLSIFLILFIFAFTVLSIIAGINILTLITTSILIVVLIFCLNDLRNNIFFFVFILSFFGFLISGDIMSEYFNKEYHMVFTDVAIQHSRLCVLISLVTLFLSYIIFKTVKNKTTKEEDLKDETLISVPSSKLSVRKSAKIIFFLTFSIYIFNILEKVVFVLNYGYVESYLTFSSVLPSIIVEIGEFAPIALFIFLATFPTKEECKLPIILYFISGVVEMISGSRGSFVYVAAFLFAYIIYRSYRDKVAWFNKKHVALIVVMVPIVLVFFQMYEYIRVGTDVEGANFFDTFLDFFVNIGSAQKIIKSGYEIKNSIPLGKIYSLGSTINYFKYGTLFNLLNLDSIPHRHSIEFALEGHSFSSIVSLLTMEQQFLSGQGAGSCYIAELFHDFGYVGVVLGNAVYGFICASLSKINTKRIFITAILFYMFMNLLEAPRASFDGFLASIVNINFILIVFVIYIFANSLRKEFKGKI